MRKKEKNQEERTIGIGAHPCTSVLAPVCGRVSMGHAHVLLLFLLSVSFFTVQLQFCLSFQWWSTARCRAFDLPLYFFFP